MSDINRSVTTKSGNTIVLVVLAVALVLEGFLSRGFGLGPWGNIVNTIMAGAATYALAISTFTDRISRLGVLWLTTLIVYTLLSLVGAFSGGLCTAVFSSLLLTKIFLLFFLAGKLELRHLDAPLVVLGLLHFFGLVLNLAEPSFFNELLREVPYDRGNSAVMGFLLNDNKSAALSLLLALYFWFVREIKLPALFFASATVMSGSVSFLIIFVCLFLYLQLIRSPSRLALFAMPSLAIAGYLLVDVFETGAKLDKVAFDGSGLYIRSVMLFKGLELANIFYPFGVGGGLFGSSLSVGSPVYEFLGIQNLPSVETMRGVFDSSVGSILGEYGFVGFAITVLLLYQLFRCAAPYLLTRIDICFLVSLTVFLSFFRTVIADFYYSAFIFIVVMLVAEIRRSRRVLSN